MSSKIFIPSEKFDIIALLKQCETMALTADSPMRLRIAEWAAECMKVGKAMEEAEQQLIECGGYIIDEKDHSGAPIAVPEGIFYTLPNGKPNFGCIAYRDENGMIEQWTLEELQFRTMLLEMHLANGGVYQKCITCATTFKLVNAEHMTPSVLFCTKDCINPFFIPYRLHNTLREHFTHEIDLTPLAAELTVPPLLPVVCEAAPLEDASLKACNLRALLAAPFVHNEYKEHNMTTPMASVHTCYKCGKTFPQEECPNWDINPSKSCCNDECEFCATCIMSA
jgi:hypothetical protein